MNNRKIRSVGGKLLSELTEQESDPSFVQQKTFRAILNCKSGKLDIIRNTFIPFLFITISSDEKNTYPFTFWISVHGLVLNQEM